MSSMKGKLGFSGNFDFEKEEDWKGNGFGLLLLIEISSFDDFLGKNGWTFPVLDGWGDEGNMKIWATTEFSENFVLDDEEDRKRKPIQCGRGKEILFSPTCFNLAPTGSS